MAAIFIDAVREGDWVRSQQAGRLVIGVVAYVRPRASWEYYDTLVTDLGEVRSDAVLEVRRAWPLVADPAPQGDT